MVAESFDRTMRWSVSADVTERLDFRMGVAWVRLEKALNAQVLVQEPVPLTGGRVKGTAWRFCSCLFLVEQRERCCIHQGQSFLPVLKVRFRTPRAPSRRTKSTRR